MRYILCRDAPRDHCRLYASPVLAERMLRAAMVARLTYNAHLESNRSYYTWAERARSMGDNTQLAQMVQSISLRQSLFKSVRS